MIDGLRWCVELAAVLIVLALVVILFGPAWAASLGSYAMRWLRALRRGVKPIPKRSATPKDHV
jgi:Sec-independent protein translocase protein TatA